MDEELTHCVKGNYLTVKAEIKTAIAGVQKIFRVIIEQSY